MIRYAVYVSAASREFSKQELSEMLVGFRERNAARGITGMLLYRDGDFMQAIEGPAEGVDALLERISWDERHRAFFPLLSGWRQERAFRDWSMGFRALDPESMPAGFSNLLRDQAALRDHPDAVHRLLLSFAESAR